MIESLQQGLDKKAIGSRIRAIRGERTQKAFAELLSATQGYISDLERGKCFPSVTFLARLTEASGRSYNWILTGKDEPTGPRDPPAEKEIDPPPSVVEIDYTYIENLINQLRDAGPSETPQLLKNLITYLIAFL